MINKIIECYYNFNTVKLLIDERMFFAYIVLSFFSFYVIFMYLDYKYFIRKTRDDHKLIAKKYSIIKKILLIHYYENIYKTVDRKLFDIIYIVYLYYIILTVITLICIQLSIYIDYFNQVSFILLSVYCLTSFSVLLCYIFGTVPSDKGGVEFRCENNHKKRKNKYKKKK